MPTTTQTIIRVRGIIMDGGEMLLVKHAADADYYALPGGHLEWGEDVRECLRREITEELGIRPEIGRLLYVNNFTGADGIQSVEFFFEIGRPQLFRDMGGPAATHAYELADVIWAKPGDPVKILPKRLDDDFRAGKVMEDGVRFI